MALAEYGLVVSEKTIEVEVFHRGVAGAAVAVCRVKPQPQLPKSENVLYGAFTSVRDGRMDRRGFCRLSPHLQYNGLGHANEKRF